MPNTFSKGAKKFFREGQAPPGYGSGATSWPRSPRHA